MSVHLPYGGSSAHRSIACPGWLKKSENIPSRPPGDAAVEGSMHHEVQEVCQRDFFVPKECLSLVYKEPGTSIIREFTPDDLDLSEITYHATNALLDNLDIDQFEVEPFVQLVIGKAGGSIDLLGTSADMKTVLILDYKFGSVRVPVENSPNLSLYAVSARHDPATADMFLKAERVVFAIIQPRAKGVVFTWECELEYLDAFERKFKDCMTLTTINPGSWCKYCPAEPFCPEKRMSIFAANLLSADHQDELNAAAKMVDEVETWVKNIKGELYRQMTRGVPVPGWKIVEKRPSTKWTDETGARAFLKTKRIAAKSITNPAALMTPIQVGKVLHKKGRDLDLSEFIVTASTGTTIATDDDSREAVIVSDVQGELKEMMK